LNRNDERCEILNLIKGSKRNNEVIFLAGPSGIGKSELVRYILEHEIPESKNIRVEISLNKTGTIENNHYLNILYKAVFKHIRIERNLMKTSGSIIKFSNLFRLAISWGKNRLGFPESARLFAPIQELDVIQKKEFIENALSGKGYIIVIENFQNIDVSSLEILNEIVAQTNNLIFIFEYTLIASDEGNIYSMFNSTLRICGKDSVKLLFINKLDFTEARRLIVDNSGLTNADMDYLEKIYNESRGNLMQIILAKNILGTNQVPIEATIEHLSKNARYLLGIMYWLETEINYAELFELTSEPYTPSDIAFSITSYEKSYQELCVAEIIVPRKNALRLRHDSIIAAIENYPENNIFYMAYATVKKYYLCIMQDPIKKPQFLECLFSLYIKSGDVDIVNLLSEIRAVVLREKYPDNIIRKLGFLEKKLLGATVSFHNYAYEALAEICHAIGMADQAEIYLNKIYNSTNPFHFALKAGILALKYHIPECRSELDTMTDTLTDNPRLQITISLCRLFGIMMTSRKSIGRRYVEQLLKSAECIESVEYGLLLRNYAELIDDITVSINVYEQALNIFRKHHYQGYEADVYIALSMLYAYLGKFKRSEKYLQRAVETDAETEKSAVYNNMAAISLLKGTYDKETLRNFNNALLLNNYDYDKCIIKCNLLIYYCLIGNIDMANELCIQVETSGHEQYNYDEFKHIVYTNLLFFSKCARDKNREDLYTNKLRELVDSDDVCESVVRLTRANLSAIEDTKYFYSKFPYRVDFLGNWRFWIDKSIAQT
jgi:tetratricopeptide (TPR) repeat protein